MSLVDLLLRFPSLPFQLSSLHKKPLLWHKKYFIIFLDSEEQASRKSPVGTARFFSELFWASSGTHDVWRLKSSEGFFPLSTCLSSEAGCWLQPQLVLLAQHLHDVSLGCLGFLIAWMAGFQGRKKCKRNRQKLFAFYYLALESHSVTFPVGKPTRFRKKHKPLLLVTGPSKSLSKDNTWKKGIVTVVFQKYHLPHPPQGKLDSLSAPNQGCQNFLKLPSSPQHISLLLVWHRHMEPLFKV